MCNSLVFYSETNLFHFCTRFCLHFCFSFVYLQCTNK
nr:MAG TPA: hypothetical protein [Caudoviricetes sp.]